MSTGRLFRFFQWNDLHVCDATIPGRPAGYPGCNSKAAWARSHVHGKPAGSSPASAGQPIEPPDFILSAGDIVHGEIADYDFDFRFMQRHLLEGLPVPFLPCLGNHENCQGEGDAALNRSYDKFFGRGWHDYAYTLAGVTFIVIDSSGGHREPDEVTTRRLRVLETALRRFDRGPIVLVTHIPLIPMRDPAVLARSFGFTSWLNLDARLLALVEAHADRIVSVHSGHLHITAAREQRGIWHIVPSGTAGFPSDFASVDFFPDHIDVRMHAFPEALHAPGPRGNIHGSERHGVDFTDAQHPDAHTYVSGTKAERAFTIPLPPGKRPDPARAGEKLQVIQDLPDADRSSG